MANSDDEILSTAQVAELIGKSARTVARMAEAGTLRPIHQLPGRNGAYLFLRGDVEALLAEVA
jgi:predicted DNA-binding transcriptional regulator AlpA